MSKTKAPTTLTRSCDAQDRFSWQLVSSDGREQNCVVEAYQTSLGRTGLYILPKSKTDITHTNASCSPWELQVELRSDAIVVLVESEELTRVPVQRCFECSELTAQWHANGLCIFCEADFGTCNEHNCRICYPLSWDQAKEPMRFWSVVFELTYNNGTFRIDNIEAHNEEEAREEAAKEAFEDYDSEGACYFWSKNVRHCYVIETVE